VPSGSALDGTAVGTAGSPGFRTRGQPAAIEALAAMLVRGMPHALLLVGPAGVGKSTLAEDIAAALVCRDAAPELRPCRTCRACRAFEHGNHPDVHRLAPTGAGSVIPIGGREERGVRDLVRDLALLPVEGGARVAIVTAADRMTEDAQSAFLKTLEEPPAGAILILTAADEERLLPTIRSRCVRIRLAPVGRRDVEAILVDSSLADAPLAAKLARMSAGRPGDAVALARSPAAVVIRTEVGRTLLDLLSATRADRLRMGRDLLGRTAELAGALRSGDKPGGGAEGAAQVRGRRSAKASSSSSAGAEAPAGGAKTSSSSSAEAEALAGGGDGEAAAAGPAARVPAAERRAAALALAAIWRDVARDLALVSLGEPGNVRQLDLLDDLEAVAARLPAGFPAAQLRRLDVAGERLEGNVSPELVVDELVVGWVA
jgi:DNA polymerase-3 subunit delta'